LKIIILRPLNQKELEELLEVTFISGCRVGEKKYFIIDDEAKPKISETIPKYKIEVITEDDPKADKNVKQMIKKFKKFKEGK